MSERVTTLLAIFNGQVSRPCASDDPQRCNPDGLLFPLGDPRCLSPKTSSNISLACPERLNSAAGLIPGSFDDTRFDENRSLLAVSGGTPWFHGTNHGLYAILDQKAYAVAGSESRGVGLFGRVMTSPSDRNLVDLYIDGGVTLTGMWDRRPDDVLGIGVAHTRIAGGARGFDRDRNLVNGVDAPVRDGSSFWVELRPDRSWVDNPARHSALLETGRRAGIEPDDDVNSDPRPASATVVGVRTIIKY
ncbi:MAG: carbohydrate porin [Hyphomicrobiaceae bacterium]